MFFSAILNASESISIPMNFLFRSRVAIPVVPEPMNGSNTILPFTVSLFITCSASSGDCAHLCRAFSTGWDCMKSDIYIQSSLTLLLS